MAHSPPPYEFGTSARYLCNTGYGLSGGDEVISCGGSGMWDEPIPTCEGNQSYMIQNVF